MSPAEALAALRAAEAADGAPDLGRRRDLLARLAAEVKRRAADIAAAAAADFGARSRVETLLADAVLVADLALFARRRLRRRARPRRVPTPFPFRPARAVLEPVPKGVVGIMAPWNSPFQLALAPAVDAIAAGNRIAVKPSEHAPRSAALIAAILEAALGPRIARCVQGDAAVAADFAAQAWDHLVFTGGTATGRKVAEAAARNLVPVTLELGGKCPVLVLPGADLAAAAREILAGKALNAGQTCVAPDTVLLIGHDRAAFEAACRASGIAVPETVLLGEGQAARLDRLAAGAVLTPLAPDGPGGRRPSPGSPPGRIRSRSTSSAPPRPRRRRSPPPPARAPSSPGAASSMSASRPSPSAASAPPARGARMGRRGSARFQIFARGCATAASPSRGSSIRRAGRWPNGSPGPWCAEGEKAMLPPWLQMRPHFRPSRRNAFASAAPNRATPRRSPR
jgi:hypothetical protein